MPETSNDSSLDFASAFGEGEIREFCGKKWSIRTLDLNDLVHLQKAIGGIQNLNTQDIEHLRLFFWLVLRKSDPDLSLNDLENENYTLTEQAVGRMLNMKVLSAPGTAEFIQELLISAGLAESPAEAEESSKNAPKAKAGK